MRRVLVLVPIAAAAAVHAQRITTPKEFLGFDVCQDYHLANYKQLAEYWKLLDKESPRISMESIGKTEDGREQNMLIITDPSNRRHLANYRKASERLARAKDFKSDADALDLAKKSKAVVWIDGGLHASEVLVGQHLIEMAYRLASANDAETKRILKDCIVLLAHANPDGQDWVADHYMRRKEPNTRSAAGLPFLYQKYCGHDNNRDFYANNMAETKNINRILYQTWYPQIVYNHHQSSPAGTIMFIPPFRNPFNYNMDPMTQIGTDLVGTHMHQRLIAEGKRGTAMRNSTLYSTWWNGGLRTTTYFHNMIGILTETWGSPSPAELPYVARFQTPTTDVPFPVIAGTRWHLRDSLEYEISANYAILDYASRYRERLLFNFYRAGRNSIERGGRDSWPRYPSRLAALGARALSDPDLREPRMYVVPSNQDDWPRASLFVQKLMQCGVEVHRLKTAAGKWPAGSFVVRCDQAFRPHVLDMFEPQDHPNDFQYQGGPPIPPYDNAGYTLAFQMGVQFDRVLDPVALETEPVGWNEDIVPKVKRPGTSAKIALWDRYGGSMESGWTRYVLEQHGYSFDLVFPPDLDAGGLRSQFDVIILPSGAIPSPRGTDQGPSGTPGESLEPQGRGGQQQNVADDPTIPLEFRRRIGNVTATTIAALREFVEQGGHLVCIGSSALNAARQLKLPVESALVDSAGAPLPNTKFYIPGSVLSMKLNAGPLTSGLPERVDTMFDNSPAFKAGAGAEVVAFFDTDKPLRSGWAWGQEVLKGAAAAVDVPLGRGRVVLYGSEILFRAQSHGTFPLLFNAIHRTGGSL